MKHIQTIAVCVICVSCHTREQTRTGHQMIEWESRDIARFQRQVDSRSISIELVGLMGTDGNGVVAGQHAWIAFALENRTNQALATPSRALAGKGGGFRRPTIWEHDDTDYFFGFNVVDCRIVFTDQGGKTVEIVVEPPDEINLAAGDKVTVYRLIHVPLKPGPWECRIALDSSPIIAAQATRGFLPEPLLSGNVVTYTARSESHRIEVLPAN